MPKGGVWKPSTSASISSTKSSKGPESRHCGVRTGESRDWALFFQDDASKFQDRSIAIVGLPMEQAFPRPKSGIFFNYFWEILVTASQIIIDSQMDG